VGELSYLLCNSSLSLGRSSSPAELQGSTEIKFPIEVMMLNQLVEKMSTKDFYNFQNFFDKPDFNSEICNDDAGEDYND